MLDLINISMRYNDGKDNEVRALNNVSMHVHQGEMIALVGESGSGKSTLLRVMGGILKPSEGQYTFNGTEVYKLRDSALARLRNQNIGYVLQDFGLLGDRNVLENICLPMMFSKMKWKSIASRAQDVMHQLRIEDLSTRQVHQLSGGQSQLVAIARALAMKTPLILADEPTGALDSETADHLMEVFMDLNRAGKTVVIVTHNIRISKMCKRIIRIHDGLLQ